MNMLTWLMRASRWSRNPPKASTVRVVLIVLGLAALLAGIEALGLWPEWATLDNPRPRAIRVHP